MHVTVIMNMVIENKTGSQKVSKQMKHDTFLANMKTTRQK